MFYYTKKSSRGNVAIVNSVTGKPVTEWVEKIYGLDSGCYFIMRHRGKEALGKIDDTPPFKPITPWFRSLYTIGDLDENLKYFVGRKGFKTGLFNVKDPKIPIYRLVDDIDFKIKNQTIEVVFYDNDKVVKRLSLKK